MGKGGNGSSVLLVCFNVKNLLLLCMYTDITAIIYVVATSGYNMVLREDNKTVYAL